MSYIFPKQTKDYPFYLRWFFRRQARKYGKTLSPSLLWGRMPGHFVGLLFLLWLFQRRRFPIDVTLRSIVSARVAQLNGCAFCVDLNSYNLLMATGRTDKAQSVGQWRASPIYTPKERALLDYAEAMTDTSQRVSEIQIVELKKYFDEDGIVALTAWIAFQNMSAKFNSALGAEESGLCRVAADAPPSHTRSA